MNRYLDARMSRDNQNKLKCTGAICSMLSFYGLIVLAVGLIEGFNTAAPPLNSEADKVVYQPQNSTENSSVINSDSLNPHEINGKPSEQEITEKYKEPSRFKMLKLFNEHKLHKDYELINTDNKGIYVLQTGIKSYWDLFWSDSAPYFHDKFIVDLKPDDNKVQKVGKWEKVKTAKTFAGYKISEKRTLSDTINANFLYQELKQHIIFMQAEKKPTSLKFFMQAKSVDVANANSYRIDMMWEILTPDVRSKQVAVRISSRLFWLGKPPNFVTKSLIERQYKSNVEEMLTFYRKWAPEMIEMSNIRKIEDNIKNIIKPHHKKEDHKKLDGTNYPGSEIPILKSGHNDFKPNSTLFLF